MRQLVTVFVLAWVLWSRTTPIFGTDPKETWEVVESLTAEAACRAQARERESRERLNLTARIRFQCFPDTVDPRPRP